MIRSNGFVDDPRFEHAPALRGPEEHVIDAQSRPSAQGYRRRINGRGNGPLLFENPHDFGIRSAVHIPGEDSRRLRRGVTGHVRSTTRGAG
jgi:hypothetical protein